MTDGDNGLLKGGISVAAGLVVAALAAVGIAGESLSRMVRNRPAAVAWPLGMAIGLIAIAIVAVMVHKDGLKPIVWLQGIPILLMAAILVFVVVQGTKSHDEREYPGISLSVTTENSVRMIEAKATSTSLRSEERMLLRVIAIDREARLNTEKDLRHTCFDTSFVPKNGRLVSWTETGPNAEGEASTEVLAAAPGELSHVCGFVALWDRDRETADDDRNNWALVAIGA
jgi:hypothetical protein